MSAISDRFLLDMRILVVDDQKFIRGMVAQGLKAFGATTIEASDGFAALTILGLGDAMSGGTLEALKRQRPDLFQSGPHVDQRIDCIVSDIRMLPMNGLEMLKAIRSGMTVVRRDLPVVIMSAHSDEALIGAAVALDAQGFVAKPVSQKAIAEKIIGALQLSLTLRPADIYKMLVIPELDATTIQTDVGRLAENVVAVIRAGDAAVGAGQACVSLPWEDIRVGDALSENMTTRNGRLVVPAGTHVTDVLIAALRDLSQVTELMPKVAVRRKAI